MLTGFFRRTCPQEYLELFKLNAVNTSEMLGPDSITFNPLHVWITDWLTEKENAFTQIGNSKSNNQTLYGNYLSWCISNGVEPIKFNQFSTLLIDQCYAKK